MVHGVDDNGLGLTLQLPDEAATLALGAALSAACQGGLVVWLIGDLGAGKTTLVRGVLRARGFSGPVKSPTYTLVELYPLSPLNFCHFDFYRLNHPQEYLDAGLDEYFSEGGVCLIEWPDKASPYVPDADMVIELAVVAAGRCARVRAVGSRGCECLTQLMKNLPAGLAASTVAGS